MRTPEVGKMVADLSIKTPTLCGKFTDYDQGAIYVSHSYSSADLVTIARYDEPFTAHFYRGLLEDHGIPCVIADEHHVSWNPLASIAIGGVRLMVEAQYAAQAHEIIDAPVDNTPADEE
jgi:hypothetical protein